MRSRPPPRTAWQLLFLTVTLLPGPACIDDPGDGEPLPSAALDTYIDDVDPILAARCGQGSCHGDPERPLALYVEPHHRLDDATGPVTMAELEANYHRARAFLDPAEPAASPLLTEPLARSEGGIHHAPGPLFDSVIDDEYQALLAWAEEAVEAAP